MSRELSTVILTLPVYWAVWRPLSGVCGWGRSLACQLGRRAGGEWLSSVLCRSCWRHSHSPVCEERADSDRVAERERGGRGLPGRSLPLTGAVVEIDIVHPTIWSAATFPPEWAEFHEDKGHRSRSKIVKGCPEMDTFLEFQTTVSYTEQLASTSTQSPHTHTHTAHVHTHTLTLQAAQWAGDGGQQVEKGL